MVSLLISIGLPAWIYQGIKKGGNFLLPSVLSFIFAGLMPVFSGIGAFLEQLVAGYGEFAELKFVAHISMVSYFRGASPILMVSTILLAVGAALALYWKKYASAE